MNAATIHVQIMEFVTGNPRILKTTGAADGTISAAAAAGAGATGCAFKSATKIAAKKAQNKKILLNDFTVKMTSDDTDCSINQTNCGFENLKIASS
jgi:hypothetical protein